MLVSLYFGWAEEIGKGEAGRGEGDVVRVYIKVGGVCGGWKGRDGKGVGWCLCL